MMCIDTGISVEFMVIPYESFILHKKEFIQSFWYIIIISRALGRDFSFLLGIIWLWMRM